MGSQRTIEDIYEDLVKVLGKMGSVEGCSCTNSCAKEKDGRGKGLSLESRMTAMESIMNECYSRLEDMEKKMNLLEKRVSEMEESLPNNPSKVDNAKAMVYISLMRKLNEFLDILEEDME